MTHIPLHHDPRHSQSLMAFLPVTYKHQLVERARLAFEMVNYADRAGRKRMIRYPKDAVFGGFTTGFITSRIQGAYPKPVAPPELTKKQQARLDADIAYRDKVRDQVSLTNYEQGQYMLAKRRHGGSVDVDPRAFIGCRDRA